MSTCASCSAQLRPEWKFCVFCGTPAIPGAIRGTVAETADGRAPFNSLAIVALLLACVGGFPALIFGHLAIAQIRHTGERGLIVARVATALGYVWLLGTVIVLYSVFRG